MNSRAAFLLSILLIGWTTIAHADKKVTLCHAPPGNPGNAHTITVGEPAVRAHLAHGDTLGACGAACPASCDDGSLCTSDSCGANGECVHSAVSCADGDPCTGDLCDPAVGCLQLPADGQECDDGSACTRDDRCAGTDCRGTAIADCCGIDADCDDDDSCTEDSCVLGSCQSAARDCAVESKCLAGFCNAAAGGLCDTVEVSCDDANVCTDDSCDAVFGCTHQPTISPPEAFEVSCADQVDNDCDGALDATDPDCHICGDGVVQLGEQCDDGNTNPFDGCDQCILVDIRPD
jgi:cysteine-rich repeat protein